MMTNTHPYMLIGIDAEGDRREQGYPTLEKAVADGRAFSVTDEDGPAWQSWEVWGNHPVTEEWMPLASGEKL